MQPFLVERLSDLLSASVLETLQTGLATQHEMPVALVEPDGEGFRYITPTDARANNASVCNVVRSVEAGAVLCRECDAEVVQRLRAQGAEARPEWHRCHLGLADVAIPIVVAEKVVAVFFSGQQRLVGTEGEICGQIRELATHAADLDPEALCLAVEAMEPRTEEEMGRLAGTLEAHAQHIAQLGQDRYDVERRLRQELLLAEVMVEMAGPCEDAEELQKRTEAALGRVNEFYRLEYSILFGQVFSRSPELSALASVGLAREGLRLRRPSRPSTEAHETNYFILTDPREVGEFLGAHDARGGEALAGAQAMICDFGGPEERATVTVFGPPREGHTEGLQSSGGDDFLERFHFEVGTSVRAVRLLIDLRQANQDKTQFLAQMTHEINAGLQTIVEESEWLQYYVDELAGISDPEITEPLEKIRGEVLRLGSRSRSSLIHLRGGMPRSEYKIQKTHPLDRLVATCVEPFRGVAQSRNINIRVDDSLRRLPRVAFDWEMMKTAFMNLLDNAVKYSHFNRTVRIFGEASEGWATVSFEDFGLGVPESEFERIFEPYVRGTQRDPRRFIWGSGLGLAVVRDIVETHGGSVSVKSVPTAKEPTVDPAHAWENFITTFTVRLPLQQEE